VTQPHRPRELGSALRALKGRAAPATPLASVQLAWPEVAGAAIAAEAAPVAERDGVVTVACRSAVWAQELEMMSPQLLERLNARLESSVEALRFTADAARHDGPGVGRGA
jgi:predicted nucleic acid-binding Zn ribbon protein